MRKISQTMKSASSIKSICNEKIFCKGVILVLFLNLVINIHTTILLLHKIANQSSYSTTICKCEDFIHKSNFRKYYFQ